MAVLDYAPSIQDLTKFATEVIGSTSGVNITGTPAENHPYLMGTWPPFMNMDTDTSTEGRYLFDFSASPDKPVLGDTFSFRFSRVMAGLNNNTGIPTSRKWLFQFKDAAGNTIGGLRQALSPGDITPIAKSYEFVAGTTIVNVTGANFYGSDVQSDYAITCSVTASTITLAIYRNNNAASLAGSTMTLLSTVSMSNTALNYGPVSQMRIGPNHAIGTNTSTYGRGGADYAAYLGCGFFVNEDAPNMFVANTLVLTTTGATLTDLPLVSSQGQVEGNGNAHFGAYLQATRDLRRTFKAVPYSTHAFPATNHNIVKAKISVNYGLSVAGKAGLVNNSDLEFFTRYSGTNYSNGRFGTNTGTQVFAIENNPATLLPFDNYAAMEFGIVLREKV